MHSSRWTKTYSRIDNVLLLVDGILPHPKVDTLDKRSNTALLTRGSARIPLFHEVKLPLDAEDGLLYARGLHMLAVVYGRQATHIPLRFPVRRVDGRRVCGLEEALGDDVDDALFTLEQALKRIFRFLDGRGEAHDEHWRVVVHHVEVAERREVRHGAVCGAGGEEGDGARGDGGDEEFVVEACWATLGVGVDCYVWC